MIRWVRGGRSRGKMAVVLSVVLLVALIGVCSYDRDLAVLRKEPLLAPPPGAVRLAYHETPGSKFMFPITPNVQVVWGVPGTIDQTRERYVDTFGDEYHLEVDPVDEYRWRGARDTGRFVAWLTLRLYRSPAEVVWPDREIAAQMEEAEWDGVIVYVSISNP